MKQLWQEILKANETNASLATVIATEGTAPRKEASKMLIIGGETFKGAVTIGGCVDAQVIEAAEEVSRTCEPQVLHARLGEEDALEIGLTCAGALRVLVEPVNFTSDISLQMGKALEEGTHFALLTVARSCLSRIKPGSKLMVASTGLVYGSLGDPRLDSNAAIIANELLNTGISRTLVLDEDFKRIEDPGHALLELFTEVVGYSPDLFIFGANQVAIPVARLASEAGFRVHVVDTRPRFANKERFPTASEIVVGFPGEIAREQNFNQLSFALLLAHSAKHDLPVLDTLLHSDARYIGVLGGMQRAAALGQRLREMGHSDKRIARVKIPVGLDIGAETAEQIAISIVGELLMVRTGRAGRIMKSAASAV